MLYLIKKMNDNTTTDIVSSIDIDWDFILEGILLPCLALPGIIGNIVCVFVFSRSNLDLKPAFSNILKCLSLFDICFLGCMIWLYCMPYILPSSYPNIDPFLTPYILPATQFSLTGSVYSVVAVAVERFFNICKPFNRNLGSVLNGGGYITVIIIFSLLFNLNKLFEYETVYVEIVDHSTNTSWIVPRMNLTSLRSDPLYATFNLVTNTVVVGIFPIFLLGYINWRIIKVMKVQNEHRSKMAVQARRDKTMTALLTGIVLVLIICHTPKTIINVYESYQMIAYGSLKYKPSWSKYVIKTSHTALVFSSAVNILIYFYKDFQFRSALMKKLLCGHKNICFSSCNRNSTEDSLSTNIRHVSVEKKEEKEAENVDV